MVWLKAPTLLYLEMFMNFLEADESKEETEKDIWNLDCLEIDLKQDITRPCRTISFTEINQLDLREELKKAVYFQLKTESMGVLQQQAGMVDPKRYIGDMVLKSR